jgi:hypothetical protein
MHVAPVACQIHACFAFRKGSDGVSKCAYVKAILIRFVPPKYFLERVEQNIFY